MHTLCALKHCQLYIIINSDFFKWRKSKGQFLSVCCTTIYISRHLQHHFFFYHCKDSMCTTHGDVRLIGGKSPGSGVVQICLHGVWRMLCIRRYASSSYCRQFDQVAQVICRQLGFNTKCIHPYYFGSLHNLCVMSCRGIIISRWPPLQSHIAYGTDWFCYMQWKRTKHCPLQIKFMQ